MPGLGVEERNDDDAFLCLSICIFYSLSCRIFSLCHSIFFQFEFLETGGVGVHSGCGGRVQGVLLTRINLNERKHLGVSHISFSLKYREISNGNERLK